MLPEEYLFRLRVRSQFVGVEIQTSRISGDDLIKLFGDFRDSPSDEFLDTCIVRCDLDRKLVLNLDVEILGDEFVQKSLFGRTRLATDREPAVAVSPIELSKQI